MKHQLSNLLKTALVILLSLVISNQTLAQKHLVILDSLWGPWRVSHCYQNIFFKLKVHWYDTVRNTIKYDIRLKSQYDHEIAVSYGIREEKHAYRGPRLRTRAKPYDEIDAGFNIVGMEPFVVLFSKLRIENGSEDWDKADNPYLSCDNADPPEEDYFVPGGELGKAGN